MKNESLDKPCLSVYSSRGPDLPWIAVAGSKLPFLAEYHYREKEESRWGGGAEGRSMNRSCFSPSIRRYRAYRHEIMSIINYQVPKSRRGNESSRSTSLHRTLAVYQSLRFSNYLKRRGIGGNDDRQSEVFAGKRTGGR